MKAPHDSRNWCWWGALLLVFGGIVYVSQHWSPSSYGVLLRQIGQPGAGLVFGEPRPIRSDEWAVVTPLTQATVRNGFERINKTSLYREDLRINYGLPIFDWGLAFKPTLWPFLWADPARAFSFHWYATLALFLAGHALLFARLGLKPPLAVLLSVGLYFTPFTQFWWNEKGPVMAFFPWVVGVLLTRWPVPLRLAACYWLGASWLITNFYPPLFLSLAFVGALILLAFGREWLRPRRLGALGATVVAAGGTAALYLKDYLRATASTLYPGQRNADGGSVPWSEWWAQFFPFSTFDWRYEGIGGQNICESGVVGAAFILAVLCLLRWRRVDALLFSRSRPARPRLGLLLGGLLLMNAWMMLRLPAWAGAPLLWNHVQPERMEYAAGLLLMLLAALLAQCAGLVLTRRRLALYAALVLAAWLALKGWDARAPGGAGLRLASADLVVLPALALALGAARLWRWRPQTAVLGASAASGALVLFGFNPIQSAQPIFAIDLPVALRQQLEADRIDDPADSAHGALAVTGFFGATANGLGFRSVSHVTLVPALDFWRQRYPDLPEAEFMGLFNRYLHIRLSADLARPEIPQIDAVNLPLADFWPDRVFVPRHAARPHHAQWLTQGQIAEGELQLPRGGLLTEVRVFIGTGQGLSDGSLHLQLCQAQHCAEASAPLAGARDNDFIRLPLPAPLPVQAGQPLRYRIGPRDGREAVALWRYPAAPDAPPAAGAPPPATSPRFVFNLRPPD